MARLNLRTCSHWPENRYWTSKISIECRKSILHFNNWYLKTICNILMKRNKKLNAFHKRTVVHSLFVHILALFARIICVSVVISSPNAFITTSNHETNMWRVFHPTINWFCNFPVRRFHVSFLNKFKLSLTQPTNYSIHSHRERSFIA